jgi:hypothetical protein
LAIGHLRRPWCELEDRLDMGVGIELETTRNTIQRALLQLRG